MSQLQPILLVLLLGAVGYAVYLWRKIAALEEQLRVQQENVEGKRSELEKIRREGRDRRDEIETLRKQLQDTRAKLKRHQKDIHDGKGKKGKKGLGEVVDVGPDSAAAVVRVSDQELETAHKKAIAKLEAKIAEAETRAKKAAETIEKMKRAEERQKKDAERAAKALAGDETEPAPLENASPEEQIEGLGQQLLTLKRAAADEKRRLEIELRKSDHKAKSALRRATNNHSLYLVVKGQLELAEDKLALLRRKYEGAKKPDEVRIPETEAEPEAVETEPVTEAEVESTEAVETTTEAVQTAPVEEAPLASEIDADALAAEAVAAAEEAAAEPEDASPAEEPRTDPEQIAVAEPDEGEESKAPV